MERPAPKRPIKLPFTLGHENAGWVEKLGPGATGFAPGDPVIVYGPWGCGNCKNCRMSMENYCESAGGIARCGGLGGYDGGMAPYLLVPSTRFLVPLETLDPREAAPLTDASLTSYHAVKRSLHLLGAGSTAVVIGGGGLGQTAIQLLRALAAATTIVELLSKAATIALLSFVVSSMLAMGTGLTVAQIIEPLRSARLVVLALLANFVLMPLVAFALAKVLWLDEPFAVGLLLLGCAAGAPFLPKLAELAKGNLAFAVGAMVLLMVVTVGYLPIVLPLLL